MGTWTFRVPPSECWLIQPDAGFSFGFMIVITTGSNVVLVLFTAYFLLRKYNILPKKNYIGVLGYH